MTFEHYVHQILDFTVDIAVDNPQKSKDWCTLETIIFKEEFYKRYYTNKKEYVYRKWHYRER